MFSPFVDLLFDAGLAAIPDFTGTNPDPPPTSIEFGPEYHSLAFVMGVGSGVLDEVGGVQTNFAIPPATSLGGDPVLFFTATFTAETPGPVAAADSVSVTAGTSGNVLDVLLNDELRSSLEFSTNAANDTGANGGLLAGHDLLLLDTADEGESYTVMASETTFNSDSVDVVSSATPTITAVSAGNQNGTITLAQDGKSVI